MNLKQKMYLYLSLTFIWLLIFVGAIVLIVLNIDSIYKVIGVVLTLMGVFGVGFFGVKSIKSFLENQAIIKQSFNSFVDEIISQNSLGVIIFDSKNKILWTSNFIKNRFGRKWIGQKLFKFFENFDVDFNLENKEFDFEYENNFYTIHVYALEKCISVQDKTLEKRTLKTYQDELSVLAEIEIDNYQLYQSILSEEQIYSVNKEVVSVLDFLVAKYNLVYRQYNTNGKFLIITNKATLDKMIALDFDFFNNLHDVMKTVNSNIIISVSAGFSYGSNNLYDKMDQAKKALLQAQSRGGDQVAVFSNYEAPRYYGSTSEILPSVDRTRIKNLTYLISKKLSDKKTKRVIIYGHANADLDAIGSAMGLMALAKSFEKEVYICSSTQDSTTKRAIAQYFENEDDIFIKAQQANKLSDENTVVFFTDISGPERTDNPEAINKISSKNIFILDHHRLGSSVDFCPKTNRLIDPSASSASEIVTEIIMFSQRTINVDTTTAQMLLNGIYLDTLQFQKHVTSKTFQSASWLESKGADSTISSNTLKIDIETYKKVEEVLANLQEVRPGFYLAYKDIPLGNDVISIAAEEILRISGRYASFVVARSLNNKTYKLSARGINTNVQIIAEAVGGGGHFGTAAAVSSENLETFIDNIKHAIVSVKRWK